MKNYIYNFPNSFAQFKIAETSAFVQTNYNSFAQFKIAETSAFVQTNYLVTHPLKQRIILLLEQIVNIILPIFGMEVYYILKFHNLH